MNPVFLSLVVAGGLIPTASASNIATTITDWLHNGHNGNGTLTLKEEIQCYSLPYGSIGFASHILTYYAVAMLAAGRSPWTLMKNSHRTINLILSSIGLLATFVVSVLTIIRCRSRWQFITMAVWKLVLSVALGCLSVHAASLIGQTDKEIGEEGESLIEMVNKSRVSLTPSAKRRKRPQRILWWTVLYVPGVCIGLTGLISLVIEEIGQNRTVERITIVFGTVVATFAVLAVIVTVGTMASEGDVGAFSALGYSGFGVLIAALGGMAFMGALYSDWILGAIAENIVGVPSTDNAALYWTYFVAKRLPFFSF